MSVSGGCSGLPAQPRSPLKVRPPIVRLGRKVKWRTRTSSLDGAPYALYRFLYPSRLEVEHRGYADFMSEPPIEQLGLLGDTRTAALVDGSGRIVWMCLPHFDGEPVFGALLAGMSGGEF